MWRSCAARRARLFGRNTIGGLVHVIRSKPTGEWGGKLVGTFAQDSQQDLKGLINFPEIGGLSVKVVGVNIPRGEYIDNPTRGTTDGENDLFMMSFDAMFAPSDTFDFRIIYDYIDNETPTRPVTALTAPGEAFQLLSVLITVPWARNQMLFSPRSLRKSNSLQCERIPSLSTLTGSLPMTTNWR